MFQRFRPPFECFRLLKKSSSLLSSILSLPSATLLPPLPTLPPSNVTNVRPPSNVTLVRLSYIAFPPLPTMLSPPFSNSFPPNLITLPPSPPLPCYTCHRTSASIGLEALPSFLQTIRAQLIRRPWPSGATVTCLSCLNRASPWHARDGQLVQEYLHRTLLSSYLCE